MNPEYLSIIQITMILVLPYIILTYNKQPIGIVPICTAMGYFMFQYTLEDLTPMLGDLAIITISISLIVAMILRLLKIGTGGSR